MPAKSAKVPKGVQKYVKSVIHKQIEDKFIQDDQMVVTAISDNATTLLINGIAPAAGVQGRVGEKIRLTQVIGNFVFAIAGGSIPGTTSAPFVRLMLIYDKQPNGAGPVLNQLFALPGAGNTFLSPLNPAGVPRYQVLHDSFHILTVEGGAANVSDNRYLHVSKKLRHQTKYNDGTAGTIADINTGSLYWLICSDVTSCVYKYSGLLRFEDA